MHHSVQKWTLARTDGHTYNNVIELGGLDVNGAVKPWVGHDKWTGVDLVAGPGVDLVASTHDLGDYFPPHCADLVLCLEMLEHDSDPNATFATIARLLTADGTALLTTRSDGFPYHHPPDYWRFTFADIAALAYTAGMSIVSLEYDPQRDHPGVFAEMRRHT